MSDTNSESVKPVRAWCMWHAYSGLHAEMCKSEKPSFSLPQICEWIEVEIRPISPTSEKESMPTPIIPESLLDRSMRHKDQKIIDLQKENKALENKVDNQLFEINGLQEVNKKLKVLTSLDHYLKQKEEFDRLQLQCEKMQTLLRSIRSDILDDATNFSGEKYIDGFHVQPWLAAIENVLCENTPDSSQSNEGKAVLTPSEPDAPKASSLNPMTLWEAMKEAVDPSEPSKREPQFLIWSIEHGMWWKQNRIGYTGLRDDAGRYDLKMASEIVISANQHSPNNPYEAIIPCAWIPNSMKQQEDK